MNITETVSEKLEKAKDNILSWGKRRSAVPVLHDGQAETLTKIPHDAPECSVYENDSELLVCADVPGVPRQDLRVSVQSGQLSIWGEPTFATQGKATALVSEIPRAAFAQRFQLPDYADGASAKASVREGVLEIRIPKHKESPARQVPVAAG